jgi:virginiamycin B lyase
VRAGHGSLWVPTSNATLERYSLKDGTWTGTATGPNPRFLDLGFGAAWVMNQGDGSVTRVDAESGEAEAIPVTGLRIGGGDLTVGAGGVWLRTDTAVLRIDPGTRRVTHLIDLPPGSGSVAAVPGSLWITNHDHLAVHRVPLPLPT